MGYIAHDAAIAVIHDYDQDTIKAVEAFRDSLRESGFDKYILGPVVGVNGYTTFVFAPDGSKEGWGHSEDAAGYREQFAEIARGERYGDGSGSGTVVHIRFGGDYGWESGTTIVSTTDTPEVTA